MAVRNGGRERCLAAGPPGSRRRTPSPVAARHRGARLGIPRPVAARPRSRHVVWCRGFAADGDDKRRALRGDRGRTETPPAKLSACATCHARGNIRTRITPSVPRGAVPLSAHLSCGLAVGRDVPIAPPRHRRGARLGK